MNRLVVSLYGGLGNQLFQYATGRAVATHYKAELFLDLAWFESVPKMTGTTVRHFALAPFKITASIQNEGASLYPTGSRIRRLIQKVFQSLKPNTIRIKLVKEKNLNFDPSIFSLKCPLWLNGYWQSPKYFQAIAGLIRHEIGSVGYLNDKSSKLMSEIHQSDAICLHIRRGDYVSNKGAVKTHGLCSIDYYQNGLSIVSGDLKNPHCYIFSDDPDWVKNNFSTTLPMTIVDINSSDEAHQDLWLMAACKRFVIANSSFSWWAAWLNDAKDKKVVCPRQWCLSKKHQKQDLIPDNWIQI